MHDGHNFTFGDMDVSKLGEVIRQKFERDIREREQKEFSIRFFGSGEHSVDIPISSATLFEGEEDES